VFAWSDLSDWTLPIATAARESRKKSMTSRFARCRRMRAMGDG
jgi:hypothetical protein